MSEDSELEILRSLQGVQWGFIDEEGKFVALPKGPLIRAGFRQPPFDVKIYDGSTRHIIEQAAG